MTSEESGGRTSALPEAPPALRDVGGRLHAFGAYRGPIADVSTDHWDRGPAWPRRLQRKGWLYAGAYHDDLMVGYAVADAGYLATAFVYLYDRARRVFVEEALEVPFGFEEAFAPSLRGAWALRGRGKHWRIDPEGDGLRFRYDGRRVSCDLRIPSLAGGMTTLAPSRGRPFNQTFKRLCLPATLGARLDDRRFDLDLPHGAAVDFTLGYPPRDTRWNWACLLGTTDDGRAFGLNLVAYFNDELENALWLGDELIPLGRGVFTVGSPADRGAWRVAVPSLDLALTVTPEGARKDRKNLGVLRHDFTQPFGRFEGTFTRAGKALRVTGHGVVEDHTSRW